MPVMKDTSPAAMLLMSSSHARVIATRVRIGYTVAAQAESAAWQLK